MRKTFLAAFAAFLLVGAAYASAPDRVKPSDIPDSVYVGGQQMHVQGLAIDRARGYMYFSFTSRFVKTDLKGNIVGSIDRIQGHLGAMTFSPENRLVYASLECKDDEIGAGIAKKLGTAKLDRNGTVFYIAIIDVDKVDCVGIDPENDPVLKTVCIKEACEDYKADVSLGGMPAEHKYGCSGIDGITIAPKIGKTGGGKFLYVAYGIYSDTGRSDNDYQVLLAYDLKSLSCHARTVTFGTAHQSGPRSPSSKYFIRTGNTSWGVQNLSYDSHTRRIFMAVYKGKKSSWPNYDLYAVDVSQKPFRKPLIGVPYDLKRHRQLSLSPDGLRDSVTGVYGWRFKYGSTGFCSLGGGWWIISENGKNSDGQYCKAVLYRWTGEKEAPFVRMAP